MALRVIDGVPGSGKTFYAVWHLALNYFKKDDKTGVYELSRDCIIITNIDGFKPDHINLNEEIDKAGALALEKIESSDLSDRQKEAARDKLDPVAEFFSYEYQEQYKEGKPQIVYVIDEAQRFFRKGLERALREKRVFDYFEYHRHWGQDIYLVTQNVKKLPSDIVYLPEYIITSLPRVRSIGIGFKYHWISSGEVIKKEVRRPDQGVFALYKSMDVAESEKITNPMLKTIGYALLAAVAICYLGYWYFTSKVDRGYAKVDELKGPAVSSDTVSQPPAVGGSYIPVGEPRTRPAEKETPYIVYVPLSSITRLSRSRQRLEWLYVWRGNLIPARDFPHDTIYKAGQRFAVIDYDMFDFLFNGSSDRPHNFLVRRKPVSGSGATPAAQAVATGAEAQRGRQRSGQSDSPRLSYRF